LRLGPIARLAQSDLGKLKSLNRAYIANVAKVVRITPARRNMSQDWRDIRSSDEPVYRVFRLDKSGHVETAALIQAADDNEAKPNPQTR
jgi:hypothetical protein